MFTPRETAKTIDVIDPPPVNVFYDSSLFYKGAQDQKVNAILKNGNSQIHQIKRRKLISELPVAQQLIQHKAKLQGFYKNPEI